MAVAGGELCVTPSCCAVSDVLNEAVLGHVNDVDGVENSHEHHVRSKRWGWMFEVADSKLRDGEGH